MSSLEGIIDHIWKYFAYDIAIDLGTANTLVFIRNKGISIREPSTVAVNKKSGQVLAVGTEAKKMIGKTPSYIVAIRPLRNGVISDFEAAEAMLRHFIHKVHRTRDITTLKIPRPRLVIGVPSGVTEVERKAVIDAALRSGARKVYLIEEPMAAAIGANLNVEDANGNMVVDIGGGTSEMAVISLGGIVNSRSIRIAGDSFDEEIINWVKTKHNLLIGEKTAENLKLSIGTALPIDPPDDQKSALIRGRSLKTGLPKEVVVYENDLHEALDRPLRVIINNIKETIEETPPEIISDLYRTGIVLCGGGALLRRLDQRIAEETKVPVLIAEDPLTAVVRGCGKTLDEINLLNKVKVV
jgi:rod shape-determining protein MreB